MQPSGYQFFFLNKRIDEIIGVYEWVKNESLIH
jgi:hypothetical protein